MFVTILLYRHFQNIIPCGITDKAVGSITQYAPQATIDEGM